MFTVSLIVITCVISIIGLKDELVLNKYSFNIEKVRIYKEYIRIISSGFFHVSAIHLIINMFVLFGFGSGLEVYAGVPKYFLIYFGSMIGGNLLALIIHKYNSGYSSVGASGAISGLVFATIALFPGLSIFFLPGWVFGLAYVLLTIYAIKSNRTDVGHAAHLGGGLIGMSLGILMFPHVLQTNWLPILAILLPGLVLIVIMVRKPELILIDRKTQEKQLSLEDRYNISRNKQKEEVDRILEKINNRGMNSLTAKEKKALEDYSKS
jgi:membrane associated rhomboid family serine protease